MKNLFHFIVTFLILLLIYCCTPREIVLDPEGRDFYETARLIMTKQERKIFNHLPDKRAREEFIRDFWAKRDPNPDTEENEFMEEFFQRIGYANKRFNEGKPGWKTDRGRIYIYLGPPDKIDMNFTPLDPSIGGSILWWVYYRYELGLMFIDRDGSGHYTLDPVSGIVGDLFGAIDRAKFGLVHREGDLEKKFMDFEIGFNREKKELEISIPVISLSFKAEEGLLKADFDFEFFICNKLDSKKEIIREIRHFEKTEEEVLRMKNITFTFPLNLDPGKYYFDVVLTSNSNIGKARKIFEIKI